ncbi:MAG: hypothetical protein RSC66_06985, partial [Comamonas sp.]
DATFVKAGNFHVLRLHHLQPANHKIDAHNKFAVRMSEFYPGNCAEIHFYFCNVLFSNKFSYFSEHHLQ